MDPGSGLRPRRSASWSVVWRVLYRLIRLLDPLIRSWVANGLPGFGGIVEVTVPGRRTGTTRRALVSLLRHDGRWYVGHPNGMTGWQRNAEAAGWVEIDPAGASGPRHAVTRLADGPERDAVIRATAAQQFFPANLVYHWSRRHVAAVGVYHRLDPIATAAHGSAPAADRTPSSASDDPTTEGDR